jgi:hypothetical protein
LTLEHLISVERFRRARSLQREREREREREVSANYKRGYNEKTQYLYKFVGID